MFDSVLGCTGKENKLEQRSTAIKYSVVYSKQDQDSKGTVLGMTEKEGNTIACNAGRSLKLITSLLGFLQCLVDRNVRDSF